MIKQITPEDAIWVRKRVNNAVMADITEFVNSDADAVEIVTSDYKSVQSARNAYAVAAKRCGYAVELFSRGDRLFMFKKGV